MRTIGSPEFSRNYGFWNEAEQQALMQARVAIAGVGGDGFQLGLKLAMNGVQTFDIADPEVFEPENTNRVPGAVISTYGVNKAEVFRDRVLEINPDADVRIYKDGVTKENVDEFTNRASLIIDESELTYLHIGTMIAREARKKNIPNMLVMNIGFAGQATSFKPEGKHTFESLMGIPENMSLDEVEDIKLDFSRILPYLPKYGDLRTLLSVQSGSPLPSISQGVDVASALGSSQAFKHITYKLGNHREEPIWAPKIGYIDAYNLKCGVASHPRLSHYKHLGITGLRQALKLNPEASYTLEDRNRRSANSQDSR
mgnify:CR=1 FL=1